VLANAKSAIDILPRLIGGEDLPMGIATLECSLPPRFQTVMIMFLGVWLVPGHGTYSSLKPPVQKIQIMCGQRFLRSNKDARRDSRHRPHGW
jgi:hypothetical protein